MDPDAKQAVLLILKEQESMEEGGTATNSTAESDMMTNGSTHNGGSSCSSIRLEEEGEAQGEEGDREEDKEGEEEEGEEEELDSNVKQAVLLAVGGHLSPPATASRSSAAARNSNGDVEDVEDDEDKERILTGVMSGIQGQNESNSSKKMPSSSASPSDAMCGGGGSTLQGNATTAATTATAIPAAAATATAAADTTSNWTYSRRTSPSIRSKIGVGIEEGPQRIILQSRPGAYAIEPHCHEDHDMDVEQELSTIAPAPAQEQSATTTIMNPIDATLAPEAPGATFLTHDSEDPRRPGAGCMVQMEDLEEALHVVVSPPPHHHHHHHHHHARKEVESHDRKKSQSGSTPRTRRSSFRFLIYIVLGSAIVIALSVGVTVAIAEWFHESQKQQPSTITGEILVEDAMADKDDDHDDAELGGDPIIMYPPFDLAIWPFSLKAIEEDPTSAPYKANAWMVNDPNLNTYPKWRQYQRFALANKYFTTEGHHWFRKDHWLSYNVSECLWYTSASRDNTNTTICDDQGHIIRQDLRSNNLGGSWRREAMIFPFCTHFDHSDNHIQGIFPVMHGHHLIEYFNFSHNQMTGPIRAEAGFQAPNEKVIDLANNAFSGKAFFTMFPLLEELDLSNNHYDGPLVPPNSMVNNDHSGVGDFAAMSHLRYFVVRNNDYTGTLPSEFGWLSSSLQVLDISDNLHIEGSIPSELGLLSEHMTVLNITGTSLTGSIPAPLCDKASSEGLFIYANCTMVECCPRQ